MQALELDRARTAQNLRTIRSPISGIVTDRKMFRGEFVTQEAHIATLAQIDPLHVEVFLPVALYGAVQAGMEAEVRPDAPVGGSFSAEVTVVDQVFDAASATFGVRLTLGNPDGLLPAGHRCKVAFESAG